MMFKINALKKKLDSLCEQYDATYIYSDPLKFPRRYDDPLDQEIAGIIASSLAYGRVERIFASLEKVLGLMGKSPARYVTNFNPEREGPDFDGFVHRFNRGEDIACLVWYLKQILHRYGSIGRFFSGLLPDEDENIEGALNRFSASVLSLDSSPFYGGGELPPNAGVRYFFPSPEGGSACKRLNLYLRWMVRKDDGLDLGIWNFVPPSKLVVPLDTHIARLSQNLGLASRKSPGWKMALEVTENLKRLDPHDPLKYDFALCRLGILDLCPHKRDSVKCKECSISDFCML
ncbi:MAG: TIGR02757 family protein [Deltaproteobacteria bacterium]|nr:TIGR02757 family protein [Deltaproteobacteria bacterium]